MGQRNMYCVELLLSYAATTQKNRHKQKYILHKNKTIFVIKYFFSPFNSLKYTFRGFNEEEGVRIVLYSRRFVVFFRPFVQFKNLLNRLFYRFFNPSEFAIHFVVIFPRMFTLFYIILTTI